VALALVLFVSTAAVVLYEAGDLPYRAYVVHTGSMSPTIPPESAVVVREGEYRVGDVVSFTVHGAVVTHRLIAIHSDGTIETKGDANRSADPWHVPVAGIVGRVVAAPHRAGYLLTYVKTPAGCASIVVALLCLWQIWAVAVGLSPKGPDSSTLAPARPEEGRWERGAGGTAAGIPGKARRRTEDVLPLTAQSRPIRWGFMR